MSKVDVLGLDNVLLDVGDLEAARGFYGGRLGLGVKFDFPEAGIVGFRLGDEEPGLLVRAGDVPPGPPGSRCSASRASCAPAGWWRSPTRGAT
jgi:catechol 2,3-dioxygenase-like lactoylglutathione lyase family enzyme